jgi:hypothetical protein
VANTGNGGNGMPTFASLPQTGGAGQSGVVILRLYS